MSGANTSTSSSSRSSASASPAAEPSPRSVPTPRPVPSPAPVKETLAADGSWRDTVEYKAAWDLEVWKAVQAERFRKQLERHKQTALAELQQRLKRQEKEGQAILEKTRSSLLDREEKLKAEELRLQKQRQRMENTERELVAARQQLREAQKHAEDEIKIQVRRANEDFEHKSVLLRDQAAAAEARARRLEDRLARSEADYMQLFEEFHRFRTDHVSGANGGGGSAAHDSSISRLESIRACHAEELRNLKEKLEQNAEYKLLQMQRRCEDLERENRHLATALARRRERLRAVEAASEGERRTVGTVPATVPPAVPPTKEMIALSVELDRLRSERVRLVEESGGALSDADPVLRRISEQIRLIEERWQGLALLNSGKDGHLTSPCEKSPKG